MITRQSLAEYFLLIVATLSIFKNIACTLAVGNVGTGGNDNNGKRKRPGWYPKDDHPCTVDQITMEKFLKKYGKQGGLPPLFSRPLVITNAAAGRSSVVQTSTRNSKFQNLTRADSILHSFPTSFNVTLSSSNSFSEHRRTVAFAKYLDEVNDGPAVEADVRSNETWYLFGETYSSEWKRLLKNYKLPPSQTCNTNDESLVALSFGIGNSGSGVQWHIHGPGFSEAIHGRKHWILYSFDNRPKFNPDQTSLNWMHYDYSAIEKSDDLPLECTLYPGDIIYFPDMWWHATINLDSYTAFVSTFTQEHIFAENLKAAESWI